MATRGALDQARACYERQAWRDAHAQFSVAARSTSPRAKYA